MREHLGNGQPVHSTSITALLKSKTQALMSVWAAGLRVGENRQSWKQTVQCGTTQHSAVSTAPCYSTCSLVQPVQCCAHSVVFHGASFPICMTSAPLNTVRSVLVHTVRHRQFIHVYRWFHLHTVQVVEAVNQRWVFRELLPKGIAGHARGRDQAGQVP